MSLIAKTLTGTLAASLLMAAPLAATAQVNGMQTRISSPSQADVTKSVTLGLDKSMVIELGYPAADVVITNPAIADAVVQTATRIIFRGVTTGQTNAFVFDRNGNQLLNLEISVEMDMGALDQLISRNVPGARVNVEGVNGNVLVTGKVNSLSEADAVLQLISAYAGNDENTQLVNMMEIAATDQVMLEVRIVEMQRSAVKQLGIRLSGATQFGELARPSLPTDTNTQSTFNSSLNSATGFGLQGGALGGLGGSVGYTNFVDGLFQSSVGAGFDALERIGVVRTLAEPTLVAKSGESGNFLAGGEFPVPVGQDQNGNVTIEFKPFGVGLGFTPVVLSEDRISLKVSTEVSELTAQGSFQGQSQQGITSGGEVVDVQALTIPALTVRRAESVIEMPSGNSMMIAGLIQSKQRQSLDQLPGIKKLPILGALFQSRDFINEDTELVIIITPYLVKPTSKGNFRTAADGYAAASDAKTIFFGKLNEQYAKNGKAANAADYRGPVGFIEE